MRQEASERRYKGKVLILGGDNRSFLAVIRSLGRKNICIHVGWCDESLPALQSKYISKFHHIPLFSFTNEWKDVLTDLIKQEQYDLVIPCNDPSSIPLQLHKKEFESIGRMHLLEDQCYELTNDKFKMQRLAKGLGIHVPKEIEITGSSGIDHVLSEISLPVVLKPRSSFTPQKLSVKNSVKKVFSEEALRDYISHLQHDEIICAQENFIGTGVGIELLACDGEILYVFQHMRVHEPLTGGGSSYRKSSRIHPELFEASKQLMQALNYTGVAMVEFKMNVAANTWVFIELNARFWGSLPLAVASGADFPHFLYEMMVTGKKHFTNPYKTGLYCRNLTSDLGWFLANLTADRSDPFLETLPLWKVSLELFNVLFLKERSDTWTIDDPKPGIAECRMLFSKAYMKIHEMVASRPVFRKRQQKQAFGPLKNARRIVFVCKGNVCRSPFAHYYLRQILPPDVHVESCGYYPQKDRACPPEAIQAGKMFGIDLTVHRSKVINQELIQHANIILTFDEENFRIVSQRFPSAKSKILRMSSLNPNSPFVIKDPWGSNQEYFQETYSHIAQLLDRLKLMIQDSGKEMSPRNEAVKLQ